jgi:molybdopterin-guanine dinucleotide biosynthesis protein A
MGGKSSRMGIDKSQLKVDNINFAELAQSKLKCYVDTVHFSINKNQESLGLSNTILDQHEGEGPLSGIISALKTLQQSIVVLGVDMPLVKKQSIKTLIKHRDWDLLSTSYYNEQTNIWEPMLSIWEIEALPCLEEYFNSGERSFQKFLNKFGNEAVAITDEREFTNVNTISEYEKLSLSS